jgi:hypothetical protein
LLWLVLPTLLGAALVFPLAGPFRHRFESTNDAFFLLFSRFDPAGAWVTIGIATVATLSLLHPRVGSFARHWAASITVNPRPLVIAWTLLALVAARLVYRGHPLSMDEYVQSFQSRAFAAGSLTGHVPPDLLERLEPPRFYGTFFEANRTDGRIMGLYWPGLSLLAVPFEWIGAPWIMNPLLGAAALLLLHDLARKVEPDGSTAGWAVLLCAASPCFTLNAISRYTMTAHLAVNLLFTVLLWRPTSARLLAAGAVGSLGLVLHNPVPHTLWALPWIVALARGPGALGRLGKLFAGYVPLSLLVGVGWVLLRLRLEAGGAGLGAQTGGAARAHATELIEAIFALGEPGQGSVRLAWLAKAFVWTVPGLPVLTVVGTVRSWSRRGVAPLALSIGLTIAFYLFVRVTQGHGWGVRYLLPTHGALALLGALALARPTSDATVGWTAVSIALAFVLSTGLRLAQVHTYIDEHLAQMPPLDRTASQVAFIDENGRFTVDLIQNDPLFRDPGVVLLSMGRNTDAELVRDRFGGGQRLWRSSDKKSSLWAVAKSPGGRR